MLRKVTPLSRFNKKWKLYTKHYYKGAPCWEWGGGIMKNGYGTFWYEGRTMLVHRWSYGYLVEPIPEGLTIDHLCRNRTCVRPSHLEAVTSRENTLRGDTPAARNSKKTHCSRGHLYNIGNTYTRKDRRERGCRICRNKAARFAQLKRTLICKDTT